MGLIDILIGIGIGAVSRRWYLTIVFSALLDVLINGAFDLASYGHIPAQHIGEFINDAVVWSAVALAWWLVTRWPALDTWRAHRLRREVSHD